MGQWRKRGEEGRGERRDCGQKCVGDGLLLNDFWCTNNFRSFHSHSKPWKLEPNRTSQQQLQWVHGSSEVHPTGTSALRGLHSQDSGTVRIKLARHLQVVRYNTTKKLLVGFRVRPAISWGLLHNSPHMDKLSHDITFPQTSGRSIVLM